MASWMRLDTRDVSSFEYDSLDVTAYGLLMLLAWRSWDSGGIPDDKALVLRALRGRIDSAAFDTAWAQVRPLLTADENGRLRIPWVEEARSELLDGRKNEAEKKRNQRLKARQGPLSPGSPQGVPGTSEGVPRESPPTDGRTDGRDERTDEPQKRAPRAAAPPPWVEVLRLEHPALPEREAWEALLAGWADARRENKHKPLGPTGWRSIVRAWVPQGLAAFQDALEHSIASGWQSINPRPRAASGAPPGTIQRGPSRGQPDARDLLFGSAATHTPEVPVRDTTARVMP